MSEINSAFLLGLLIGGASVWIPCFIVHRIYIDRMGKSCLEAMDNLGKYSRTTLEDLEDYILKRNGKK